MKKLAIVVLTLSLAVVMLLSMGGIALADVIDPVVDPPGLPDGCYEPVTPGSLSQQDANMNEWHFVLNQWDNNDYGPKPAYILVEWSDAPGTYEQVPLSSENAQVGHYYAYHADGDPAITVLSAYAPLGENCDFDGNLVLSMPSDPIPELSTIVLVSLGVLGMGGFVWFMRRRKAAEIAG